MKRNKKKLISIVVIIVLTLFLYSNFSYYTIKVNNKYADEFYQDLIDVVKKKTDFDMKDVARFDWDRMIVFYPYTTREEIFLYRSRT